MTGTVSWILSLKAIADALIGLGVIKGKNCQVKSIVRNGTATVITFAWYDDDEVLQETAFTVYDGIDGQDGAPGDPGVNGINVVSAEITATNHLVFTMSNDTTIDAGVISSGSGGASVEYDDGVVIFDGDAESIIDDTQASSDTTYSSEKIESLVGNVAFRNFCDNIDVDYEYDSTSDANYTVIRIYKNKLDGTKQYPFVYAPNGINPCQKTSLEIANEDSYFLVANAGIFNTTTHVADGQLVENGIVLQNSSSATHSECRPLVIDENGDMSEALYNADANTLVANGAVSVVTGFMAIIKDFEKVPQSEWNSVSHYTQNAQRQIIGQFGNGDYAIITCEGRGEENSDGWTIAEAQDICVKLGLRFAYNLDGGGSTETCIGKKMFNHVYEGTSGRKVPTFIVFNGKNTFDVTPVPSTYTVLSSLKKSGYGSYIDLGIAPDTSWTVEYKVDYTSGSSNGPHILSSSDWYYPMLRGNAGGVLNLNFKTPAGDNLYTFENALTHPSTHVLKYEGTTQKVYLDGNELITASNVSASTNNLRLFAYASDAGNTNWNSPDLAIEYCKVWDGNGILIHDYEPRKRVSDNVCGMLDITTNTFYASSGNDAFVEG